MFFFFCYTRISAKLESEKKKLQESSERQKVKNKKNGYCPA